MRPLARLLSYAFHPLLGPTYILLLLLAVNPYLFGVGGVAERLPLVALVFASSFLVPGLVIVMMVGLEMLPSLHMPEREQRTVPLLAVGMLFLGLFAFCRKAPEVPVAYTATVLGCVVGLFAAFFANLFTKVSLHAVGMGGIVAAVMVALELFAYHRLTLSLPGGTRVGIGLAGLLAVAVVIAGLVGTARLALGVHRVEEVAGGYLIGFLAMAGSVWVYF